jgi:hypothetical protein
MRRLLHSILVCGLLARSSVFAQELSVEWQAPVGCPDEAELRDQVVKLLERIGAANAAGIQVRGRVRSTGGDWTLRLKLTVPPQVSVRELHAGDCQSLSTAAIELMRLAFDRGLTEQAPSASQQPGGTSAPATEPPAPSVREEVPASESAPTANPAETPPAPQPPAAMPSFGWRLGAAGGVFAAGLAGAQLTAGVRFGVELNGIVLDVYGSQHFARSRPLTPASAEFDFDTQEVGLAGCRLWGDALRAGPCLAIAALHTRASSTASTADSRSMFWGTVAVSALVSYPLSDMFELRFDAGMWLPITRRPLFVVDVEDTETTVGEASSYGAFARLSLGVML